MNELFDAIMKYLTENGDADVQAFRDLCAGGIWKHIAPHDTENPWLVVSSDTPTETTNQVMHRHGDKLMYADLIAKYSLYTTVELIEGHDQLRTAMDALEQIVDDYVFTDEGYGVPNYRVLHAHVERRFIFPDPDGGFTGHIFVRYIYGDK